MPPRLTDELIQAAIQGYQQQRDRLDEKIAELRSMQAGYLASTAAPAARRRGKSRLSPEARARIAAAQRARWAKAKGESGAKPAAPKKKKRRLSKEGRDRIIAATKARWARVRAEKEQAAAKKAGKKAAA